jgi:arginine decarboxylase
MFLTQGVGVHRHALTAFEFALRDADIEQQNLVYVSSILPPRCEVITREAGVELLRPGDITFCVMARSATDEFGRHVYASLGLAKPADPDMYGYISELHGYGMTAEAAGEEAEDLAATMLASTLGLDFDPRGWRRAQAPRAGGWGGTGGGGDQACGGRGGGLIEVSDDIGRRRQLSRR